MPTKTSANWKVTRFALTEGIPGSLSVNEVAQSRNFAWSRTGDRNPNYKAQIKRHECATTSLIAEQRELVHTPISSKFFINYGGTPSVYNIRELSGDYFGYYASLLNFDEAEYDITTADSLARGKFYNSIKSTQSVFQGGVFLGELRETLRMLRSPLKGVLKELDNYRKAVDLARKGINRGPGRLKKLLEAVRQGWLEFQFGVKPLISDIRGIASSYDHLTSEEEDLPPSVRIRGVGKWRSVQFENVTQTDLGGFLFATVTWRRAVTCTVIYSGGIDSELQSARASASRLLEVLGFGPDDFVPTLYELIPFSWAADYFSNLGTIISSTHTRTNNVKWIQRTVLCEKNDFITGVPDIDKIKGTLSPLWGVGAGDLGYGLSTYRRVIRDPFPVSSLSPPSFVLKVPAADSLKWLNLAAVFGGFRSLSNLLRS